MRAATLPCTKLAARPKTLPGVLEAHDMTPEATAVKLMWVLGQTTDRAEAEKLFLNPRAVGISCKSFIIT